MKICTTLFLRIFNLQEFMGTTRTFSCRFFATIYVVLSALATSKCYMGEGSNIQYSCAGREQYMLHATETTT